MTTSVPPVPINRVVPVVVAMALTLGTIVVASPAAVAAVSGPTKPMSRTGIAGWRMVGSYQEPSLTAGEGLATVTTAHHGSHLIYRGLLSVPKTLAAEGWTHIGGPDAADGYRHRRLPGAEPPGVRRCSW